MMKSVMNSYRKIAREKFKKKNPHLWLVQ